MDDLPGSSDRRCFHYSADCVDQDWVVALSCNCPLDELKAAMPAGLLIVGKGEQQNENRGDGWTKGMGG